MLNGGSTVTPNTVTTIADGSIGVHAASAGAITIVGPTTISTGSIGNSETDPATPPTGANAYGVNADGLNSKVTLSGATTVTTLGIGAFGQDAYGLYASNGGTIDGSLGADRRRHDVRNRRDRRLRLGRGSRRRHDGVDDQRSPGGHDHRPTGRRRPGVLADWRPGDGERRGSVTTNGGAPGVVAANGAGSMVTLTGASLLTSPPSPMIRSDFWPRAGASSTPPRR